MIVATKHHVVVVAVWDGPGGGQGLDGHFDPLDFGKHRSQMPDHNPEVSF